jgi:hypothetical protein
MKYQYFNSDILLVINPKGQIRKLYTPFRAQTLANNSWVYVNEILTNGKDELIFIINSQPMLHHHFRIVIDF